MLFKKKLYDIYIKAIYQYAEEENKIMYWKKILFTLKKSIKNETIQKLMLDKKNNYIVMNILKKTLIKNFHKDIKTQNLLTILYNNNRLFLLHGLYDEFCKKMLIKKNIQLVYVTTSYNINIKYKQKIIEKIQQNLNCKVNIKEIVDPSIIGGIIIKINDFILDNSLKTKINQLKHNIVSRNI